MAKVFETLSVERQSLTTGHQVNKGEEWDDQTMDSTRVSAPQFTITDEACEIIQVQILKEEICESPIQSDSFAGHDVEEGTLGVMVKTEDFGEDYALTSGADCLTHQTSSSFSSSSFSSSCPSSPSSSSSSSSSSSADIKAELLQEEDGGSNMNPALLSSDMIECPPDLWSRFQLKRLSVRLVDCCAPRGQKGTTNTNKNGYMGQHQYSRTGEKRHHCQLCNKSFARSHYLKTHIRIHTGERPYPCQLCNKSCSCPSALKIHQRSHTGERPYHCTHCWKSFATAQALTVHMRVHTGEKPYRCSYCGKSFSHSNGLKVHQRVHTGEKPYECGQCGRSFAEGGTLKKHQLVHTREKKLYQCEKRFTQPEHLTSHQRILTSKKLSQQCEMSFSHGGQLGQHQLIHTGEKAYRCHQSGLGFAQEAGLQQHRLVHTREKGSLSYQGSHTSKVPAEISVTLEEEEEEEEDEEEEEEDGGTSASEDPEEEPHHSLPTRSNYQCQRCGTVLSSRAYLHEHQLAHATKPYHCQRCRKSFSHAGGLRVHQGGCHAEWDRPYQCSAQLCGRRFFKAQDLSEHQLTHTVDKPHRCGQCGLGFAQQIGLKQHRHIHTREKPPKYQQRSEGREGPPLYQCQPLEGREGAPCGRGFSSAETLRQPQLHTGHDKPYPCPLCGLRFARERGLKIHQAQVHKESPRRVSRFPVAGNIRPTDACKTIASRNRNVILRQSHSLKEQERYTAAKP